ncbi:MAG: reverse transcriptase family protein [Gemmataceae bacterium]|nr:reverse transcriptase family protein [Gemmataceae bacterium]
MGFFSRLIERLFGKTDTGVIVPKQAAPGATAGAAPQAAPPLARPLNLSADNFLPIARDELKEAAKDVTRWGPWFGRRDVIPPADDPRTRLIDRGMVANGLLTQEQLVEIHQVGAEMERLRPLQFGVSNLAAQAGESAVQAERARRTEIKKQKKAEAADRKKRRAEAIVQRHATDIVFLGRGVSARLGERTSDGEKLKSLDLPMLQTPAELASALGIGVPRLRWLAFHAEVARRVHYVGFTVPKKSGGTRTLSAPHRSLAAAQEWILRNILDRLPVEASAHGFVIGRGTLTNANLHVGRAILVNMDLQDFFPSIGFPRVRSVFQRLGYSPAVATVLALLCTECPRRPVEYDGQSYHVAIGPRGLPQGACTSPALSNQVARRLDRRLHGLALTLGVTYTRYADDLTFSGAAEFNARVGYLMARIRHIAEDECFAVNARKSRVLRRNTAQRVTGLVVNDKPGIGRQEVRRLRAILHRAAKEGLEQQNREGRPNFTAWLHGKIAYVSMVRPDLGARFQAQLHAILQGK